MSLSPLWILGLKWTVLDQMYHTCQWPALLRRRRRLERGAAGRRRGWVGASKSLTKGN